MKEAIKNQKEWGKIFAYDISSKELVSEKYKELILLNIKKQIIQFKKMGRGAPGWLSRLSVQLQLKS